MLEYGITTSEAFIWAHVCPLDASIYWYKRTDMLSILSTSPAVEIASAKGHLVRIHTHRFPSSCIHDADLGYDFFDRWPWESAKSDSEIGEFAELCFPEVCPWTTA